MSKSRPDKSVIPNNLNFERIEREVNEGGGFYHETEHHVISYTPGKRRLLVSFDNLASLKSKHPRKPWGQDIAQKNGWGSLGVMTKKNDWFRSTELTNYLSELRAQGLFESYPAVSMYGASMGGYAACLFAPLAPGCTVVAFAPQSSLSAEDAPFEKRYRFARRNYDWNSTEWRDAAQGIKAAGKAYLIYDPTIPEDLMHAQRLTGPQVSQLTWPGLTHKVPPTLRRLGILGPVAKETLTATMTHKRFHELMRVRMSTPVYVFRLMERASAKGHYRLVEQAIAGLPKGFANWKIRQLRRRNAESLKSLSAPQK
ncbi:hypothetical protein DSM14862_03625 (plasmid) [Sulfitobacter indolifex]|uniref:hypothetical protein n=1 Tax=Sulfitobacter indolifex TaxID=225422 RepID=UPI001FAD0359|nr:hypothetical protein [Sulfitobacter indolifex]UOA20644.1 hypothetical protein DSM14862_03482 [Sulfitobacter indolifex]UOA20787.1 hypothetical protein DSM14862_03625 [Sulfitobacter indolifex]